MGETAYLVLKSLHVLGAVLFVGNLLVTAVWKMLADRTGDGRIVAFAQRLVTVTDVAFTGLGSLLLLTSGLLMIVLYDVSFWRVRWLVWGLALFVVSALVWILVLVPLQLRQARLARGFAAGGAIPADYLRLARLWYVFGAIATALPLVTLFLMVLRPL